jgi:hypothetical protein
MGKIGDEDFIGFERFLKNIRGETDREKLRKAEAEIIRLRERIRKLSEGHEPASDWTVMDEARWAMHFGWSDAQYPPDSLEQFFSKTNSKD